MDTLSPALAPAVSRRAAPEPDSGPSAQYLTLRLGEQAHTIIVLNLACLMSPAELGLAEPALTG